MTIYTQALDLITKKAQWTNGETANLFNCQTKKVFIRNGGKDSANLYLTYQNGSKPVQVKCGFFSPMRGWIFSLTQETYARWVKLTGHTTTPEKTFEEKTIEWRNSPAGQAYMDLSPSSEVLAELRAYRKI